jgi:hypothetical protein
VNPSGDLRSLSVAREDFQVRAVQGEPLAVVEQVTFAVIVALVPLCAWRFPRTVEPLTVGIAAAGILVILLHL